MNPRMLRPLRQSFMVIVFAVGMTCNAFAQSSDPNWKPVIFKPPAGYMFGNFPEKRAGKILLDPKRPDGMFVVYPKEGETPDVLLNVLKSMVAGMFLHDSKSPIDWTAITLPAHKGIDNESGTLYSASNEKIELQLAVYARTLGATKVLYGYYGMRHKGERKKDDAPFMDSSGKGVEDFDKLWKSMTASK